MWLVLGKDCFESSLLNCQVWGVNSFSGGWLESGHCIRHRPTGDIAARVTLLLIQSRRTRVRGGFGVRPLMVGDNCLNVLKR